MTVETTGIKVYYEGNGVNSVWPVPFRNPPTDDYLHVMVRNKRFPNGVVTSDFEVQGIGTEQLSIVYPRPGGDTPLLASGEQLLIYRELPLQQHVRLRDNQPFHASTHEGKFDWLCMTDQQLQEQLERCLKVSMFWDDDVPTVDEFMNTMGEFMRRAEDAANRAEDAAAWVEAVYKLAGQTANIRWSWLADKDYPAGSVMPLKVYYYPGRNMLHLSINSLACVPQNAAISSSVRYQYAEQGELESLSNLVTVDFDVKQGDLLDAWVISSITQEQFEKIFNAMQAALDAAQRAEYALARVEELAAYQELAGQTVNSSMAWVADSDMAAGEMLTLPKFYWPGRRQFILFHNSLPCVPDSAVIGSQAVHQYEEIGDSDALSNRVQLNFPVKAGDVFYIYVLSSITQKMFDDVSGLLEQTQEYVAQELLNIEQTATAAAELVDTATTAFSQLADNAESTMQANLAEAEDLLAQTRAVAGQVEALSTPVILLDINGAQAGEDFTVPAYTVGSNRLEIYIEGLLVNQGDDENLHQFTEIGDGVSTLIHFYDTYPAGTVITAVSRG